MLPLSALAAGTPTGFDWATFWTALGAIAALLALGIGVFGAVGYFRANPKRRLEFSVVAKRLIAGTLPNGSAFRIEINGVEIADPYLVNLTLVSNSRADIPTTSFDGNKPILIRSEPGGALVLNDDEARAASISILGGHGEGMEWAEYQIQPQLIRKRSSVELIFVTDGPPNVTVTGDLVDIDIVEVNAKATSVRLRDFVGDVTISLFGLSFTLHRP